MKYVFDIALIAVIVFFVFIGKKTGFVRCVLNLIKSVAAFILARFLSEYAAQFVFDKVIKESLAEKINEALIKNILPAKQAAWEAIPSFIRNMLSNAGIESENFLQISSAGTSESMAASSVEAVKSIIVPLISLILLILFFIIISLLLGIVIKLIDRFFDLPVLSALNAFLGALAGALLGVFTVALICAYWNELIMLLPQKAAVFLGELSQSSALIETFAGILK